MYSSTYECQGGSQSDYPLTPEDIRTFHYTIWKKFKKDHTPAVYTVHEGSSFDKGQFTPIWCIQVPVRAYLMDLLLTQELVDVTDAVYGTDHHTRWTGENLWMEFDRRWSTIPLRHLDDHDAYETEQEAENVAASLNAGYAAYIRSVLTLLGNEKMLEADYLKETQNV
jgi:hypothetical protein